MADKTLQMLLADLMVLQGRLEHYAASATQGDVDDDKDDKQFNRGRAAGCYDAVSLVQQLRREYD